MYTFEHDGARYGVILPPKTATRSYERALKQMGATAHHGRHKWLHPIIEAQDTVVASIRHPCDVLVSWYHYDRKGEKKGIAFPAYVGYVLAGGNLFLKTSTLPGARHADYYLRYEDGPLAAWNAFMKMVGKPPLEQFEHIGKAANRRRWQSYYTPELLAVVEAKYKKDFRLFGYEARL